MPKQVFICHLDIYLSIQDETTSLLPLIARTGRLTRRFWRLQHNGLYRERG